MIENVKLELTCRFCKNKDGNSWATFIPGLETEEEAISRARDMESVYVCDTCKELIIDIVKDSMR